MENENILAIDGIQYDRSTFNQEQQILDTHVSKLINQRTQLTQELAELEVIINALVTTLVNSLDDTNHNQQCQEHTESNTVFNTVR